MSITDRLFQRKNELAAANLKAGNDFLAANGQKPGVTELPSGLQYEVIHMGDGPKPGPTSKVTCHYHGTLIDGTMFDSSVKRGVPATFPLNAVIKGWTEGLQLMPTGSKWRFFIPAYLGYGERQVSAQIGPNATLVFEVELISFTN
jgi:FKBP-type peptidyl-prolyl cis-trans isomerase FklB